MTVAPIIETNRLICRANQWTGFYMIRASVMKELIQPAITCSKLTTETLEQGLKYVPS